MPDTFLVNLGNHRANITNVLVPMRTTNEFDALNFLADEALAGQSFKRTIVFFNTRELAYKGSQHLKRLLPDARRHEIDFLHAGRTGRARRRILMNFRKQKVNVLCATEAAGMVRLCLLLFELKNMSHFQGMDIPDIELVIQFMVAHSLSVLIQRFGRAGRSGQPAVALLLAEPSVFQVKKKATKTGTTQGTMPANLEESEYVKEETIDDLDLPSDAVGLDAADVVTQYKKKTETGMQDWCLTLGCRWDVSDKYFNNPSRLNGMSLLIVGLHCNLTVQVLFPLYAAITVFVEDETIPMSPSPMQSRTYSHLWIAYGLRSRHWQVILKMLLTSIPLLLPQKIQSVLDPAARRDSRIVVMPLLNGEAAPGLRSIAIVLGAPTYYSRMPFSPNWPPDHTSQLSKKSRRKFLTGISPTTMALSFWSSFRMSMQSGCKTTIVKSKRRKKCENDVALKTKNTERRRGVLRNGQKPHVGPRKGHGLTLSHIQQLLNQRPFL
jgi:hypothetical protein